MFLQVKLTKDDVPERTPKNFRKTEPECCFTCSHSETGEVTMCEFNYGNRIWGGGDRTGELKKGDVIKSHFGVHGLGLCDEYERR